MSISMIEDGDNFGKVKWLSKNPKRHASDELYGKFQLHSIHTPTKIFLVRPEFYIPQKTTEVRSLAFNFQHMRLYRGRTSNAVLCVSYNSCPSQFLVFAHSFVLLSVSTPFHNLYCVVFMVLSWENPGHLHTFRVSSSELPVVHQVSLVRFKISFFDAPQMPKFANPYPVLQLCTKVIQCAQQTFQPGLSGH